MSNPRNTCLGKVTRSLRKTSAFVGGSALCLVVLRAWAVEPAYLAEFPDPKRIAQDFQGSDRLDTLALQVAALTRLNRLVNEMAGDRYYAAGKFPTPDEARVIAAIRAAATPLGAEAEATFDPKARGADSPRTQWRQKSSAYERGEELYSKLMQLYFSPAFRDAHGAKLVDKRALQAAGREDLERRGRDLRGERDVRMKSHAVELGIGLAALALLVLGSFRYLRATTVTSSAPYRFRVGLKSYPIEHATGTIANYARREVMGQVFRHDKWTNWNTQRTELLMEVYEDLTLDEGGRSEPIHLATFYPDASHLSSLSHVGDRKTVLWTTIAGERRYLCVKGPRLGDGHAVTRATFAKLFPRPNWTAAPALVLGFVVGDLVVASEYSGLLAIFVAYPVWVGMMKLLIGHRARALGEQLTALAKQLYEAK